MRIIFTADKISVELNRIKICKKVMNLPNLINVHKTISSETKFTIPN